MVYIHIYIVKTPFPSNPSMYNNEGISLEFSLTYYDSPTPFFFQRGNRSYTHQFALVEAFGMGAESGGKVGRFDKSPAEILITVFAIIFGPDLAIYKFY